MRKSAARFRRRAVNPSGPLERILILLVLAAIIGVSAGLLLPQASTTVGKVVGNYTATGSAADTLAGLAVNDNPDASGYDRDSFAFREYDADGNGCDTREDILARDLTEVQLKAGDACTVVSGELADPYTGQTIHFVRGRSTSAAVQIDHVVALENAWQSGARDWDSQTRREFANDPYNLLAVDGPSNSEKGSSSAAYWLPTNSAYRCDYVARQIGVKDKYQLTVTSAERDAMLAVLHTCPGQAVPQQ
ncbi:HNH endonuclease family protein [Bifidobacterium oedipodis]|nr:HNH endonuclease family protein [Bifidobacterium sp. DSM 109957]